MSEKTVRVCDVCGKVFKDVEPYVVDITAGSAVVHHAVIDLCPAHLKRLQGFVERGCSPLKGSDSGQG